MEIYNTPYGIIAKKGFKLYYLQRKDGVFTWVELPPFPNDKK